MAVNSTSTTVALAALASLMVFTLGAHDWPEFRGPTGQGHSPAKDVPIRWSATENVAWKTAITGGGWSSPVLVNGRLYLTTAKSGEGAKGLQLIALCLDARDGTVLWSTNVFSPEDGSSLHRKNSYASPTPLVREGRLYVHFGHLGTACLDLDGRVWWRQTSIQYPSVHGNGGSPVLAGERLIFSCDGITNPVVVRWTGARARCSGRHRATTDPSRRNFPSAPRCSSRTPGGKNSSALARAAPTRMSRQRVGHCGR